MKKALLLQLPVPGFLWPTLDANVPLAAGYLAAWARHRRLGWDVEVMSWQEADVLGDEALLRAVLARAPDVVGLSLYLWNAERSLHLAKRLHETGVAVLVGGPEVDPTNHWLWDHGGFAAGIVSEGEEPFVRALKTLARGFGLESVPGLVIPGPGPGPGRGPAAAAPCDGIDLRDLPSPYLAGLLGPYPDGTVWLETQRGCPFRCAYCRYGKQYAAPRPFPPGWLRQHLAWAREHGGREVYLMDPAFNVRPDWENVLAELGAANADGSLSLHTELVADRLRPGDALRLARAGLRSCEIGLQTVRAEALAEAGRPWDRSRWLRGVRELLDAGVSTVVGLIVGLPGDDLAGFEETLSFLHNEVPQADLQVFPLALLPGTRLRQLAPQLGVEFLPKPPYTVTRTPGYSAEDLARAFDLFEEATGLELDPFGAPAIGGSWTRAADAAPPYLSGVRIDAAKVGRGWVDAVASRAARNLTLWIRGWSDALLSDLARLGQRLPHGVLTLVLEDEPGWPPGRLEALLSAAGSGDHYLDRYFRFLYGPGARVVPRIAALVETEAAGRTQWLGEIRAKADVVWGVDVQPNWLERATAQAAEGEAVYVRGEPTPEELGRLRESLADDAGEILFASPRAEAVWQSSDTVTGGGPAQPVVAREHRDTLP